MLGFRSRQDGVEEAPILEFADALAREKIQRLQVVLSVTLVLLFLSLSGGGLVLWRVLAERNDLRLELSTTRLRAEAELDRSAKEMAEIVNGRIPNLMPLEFDRAISLEESYVRNVTFTLVSNTQGEAYEYRVVFHNQGGQNLNPSARILLFDKGGMQTGTGRMPTEELHPGEVRSHTGIVEVIPGTTPLYFAVVTGSGVLTSG